MLKQIVCLKQVPMVSELPWDPKTGTLRRDLAEGMMNPACANALEMALQLKHRHGGPVIGIAMGPPMAEEVLYEAIAMGADRGVLLTDPYMAGGDTQATSFTLARAIKKECPDFDLVLCGCHTSDSETAQVGPQLAEELAVPTVAYVEQLEIKNRTVRMERLSDDFLESLEMDLPALVTIATQANTPRHPTLEGLEAAFRGADLRILTSRDLGLPPDTVGVEGSPTRIQEVYSPTEEKRNVVMKGAANGIVDELFETFGDQIAGAIGKDLKIPYHNKKI